MITQDRDFLAETIPPSLAKLGRDLAKAFDVPANHVGIKGDDEHFRGYHRSRRFLMRSGYAGSRSYSVTDHPGNAGGDPDWCCALDLSLPHDKLVAACQRLDVAVRAGRLEKIAEWYGSTGDDRRVDGYDNIRNAVATSDRSHLWHLHVGFIRKHAGDDHSDVLAVLTGKDKPMTAEELVKLLRDPDVTRVLQDIVKEARFDLPGGGKPGRWSIGSALTELLNRPTASGGPGASLEALADALWHKFVAAITGSKR